MGKLTWAAIAVMTAATVVILFAVPTAPVRAPQVLAAAPVQMRIEAVATLATNACEAETAADYTALVVVRRTAAKRLLQGTLPVTAAVMVQERADAARALLDAACPGGKPNAALIAQARERRAGINALMESAR